MLQSEVRMRRKSKSRAANRLGSGRSRYMHTKLGEQTLFTKTKSLFLAPLGPLFFILIVILLYILVGIYLNDRLPSGYAHNQSRFEFSATNSLQTLIQLTDIGPKVTGSHRNEFMAINYIKDKVYNIMKSTSPNHNLEFDLQEASGQFSLNILSKNITLLYSNVQNIVVKIGPTVLSKKSLLINCHFDSVPLSPGASDDGLNCAVMLEVLRVLSVSDETLPHNVIFLFNGAEENPLLGSHGFITQHKWATDVQAFLNLESCGAGGREILFQAGPNHPWLIQTYAKSAKYPSGIVTAEEIFQSGLVPSDTDFRIFRDHGRIPGLDFAHCKNGYVYHTKFDNVQSIDNALGVIQHTGENILSLTRNILKAKEFENNNFSEGNQVYYDLFGLYFVNYSSQCGKILNFIAISLAIAGIYLTAYYQKPKNTIKIIYRIMIWVGAFCGMAIICVLYNVALAYILDAFGLSMSWYSNSLNIIPLYCIPTIFIMLITIVTLDRYDKTIDYVNQRIKLLYLSYLIFWAALLFLCTYSNVRSSFLLLLMVLPPALYTFISSLTHPTSNRFAWSVAYILVTVPTSVYFVYLGITVFRVFIPITGRSGTEKNPEFLISILSAVLSFPIFCYITPLILTIKKRWISINIILITHFFFLICAFVLPSSFPFSTLTPQRVLVTHVNREFFEVENSMKRSDSLFWVQNVDRRGRSVLPLLKDAPLLDEFCSRDGYCGLPWYSKIQERSGSTCVSSSPHNIVDETNLTLLSKSQKTRTTIHFEMSFSGPDHIGLIFTPAPDVILKAWSFPGEISRQPSYMVGYVHGLSNKLWNMWFELQIPDSNKYQNSYIEIEIYGLYFHHHQYFSDSFLSFISKFPKWVHVTPALAIYKSFLF